MPFLTRKRGTSKQIGSKFPVRVKLKLPDKISIKKRSRLSRLLSNRKVTDIEYDKAEGTLAGNISLMFDGRTLHSQIIIVPNERYVATWDRYTDAIYIDDNMPKKYWKSLAVHETVERYLRKQYGLDEYKEGHQASDKIEKKTFLSEHPLSEWAKYSNIVNKVHKEEMYMAGGKLVPRK